MSRKLHGMLVYVCIVLTLIPFHVKGALRLLSSADDLGVLAGWGLVLLFGGYVWGFKRLFFHSPSPTNTPQ